MTFLKEMLERAMLMEQDNGGAGAGTDADSGTGEPVVDDADGATGATGAGEPSPEGDGTGDDSPQSFKIGERTLTEQEMLDAVEISDNKAKWEEELHRRGEDNNAVAQALERARSGQPTDPNAVNAGQPNAPGHVDMTAEALRDMMTDDPQKFISLVVEKVSEASQAAVASELGTRDTKQAAQEHFLGKNADYNEVVNSPEFASYMKSLPTDPRGTPIYSTANGYLQMQLDAANARLAAAEKAGFDKGSAVTQANIEAKSRITVLKGGGGGAPAPPTGPDLKGMSENEVNALALKGIMDGRARAAGQ